MAPPPFGAPPPQFPPGAIAFPGGRFPPPAFPGAPHAMHQPPMQMPMMPPPNQPIAAPPAPASNATSHPDWQVFKTKDDKTYYFNKRTQQTTWEKPEELKTEQEKAMGASEWQEFKTPEGKPYYYNTKVRFASIIVFCFLFFFFSMPIEIV
jgi:hypothetical protein